MSGRTKERTLRTPQELLSAGLIGADGLDAAREVASRYAVAVTPEMAALIDRADPNDPIAQQFVPHIRELEKQPEELADPQLTELRKRLLSVTNDVLAGNQVDTIVIAELLIVPQ